MAPDATTRTLHEAARLAVAEQRYQDAARCLERAVAHDPSDAWAHDLLGIAYQRMGRDDDALKEFQQAVSIAPDHAVFLYNLGAMLAAMGQSEEATEVLAQCVQHDPGHQRAQSLLDGLSVQA